MNEPLRAALTAAALALPLACTHAPAPTLPPSPPPAPPPTFVEVEPTRDESPPLYTISVALADGLLLNARADPFEAGRGWGVRLEFEFFNTRDVGTFDLGDEPLVMLMVSVTRPDGSGFGSGGGCTYGSRLHGSMLRPLEPGSRYGALYTWSEGAAAGELLEIGLSLCGVVRPDGRPLSGQFAQVRAQIGPDGQVASFELRADLPR